MVVECATTPDAARIGTCQFSPRRVYECVVEFLGVVAGAEGVANDGVLADADQTARLADADALLEVGQGRGDLVEGQAATEQGRALALGEAGLAGLAVQ